MTRTPPLTPKLACDRFRISDDSFEAIRPGGCALVNDGVLRYFRLTWGGRERDRETTPFLIEERDARRKLVNVSVPHERFQQLFDSASEVITD